MCVEARPLTDCIHQLIRCAQRLHAESVDVVGGGIRHRLWGGGGQGKEGADIQKCIAIETTGIKN